MTDDTYDEKLIAAMAATSVAGPGSVASIIPLTVPRPDPQHLTTRIVAFAFKRPGSLDFRIIGVTDRGAETMNPDGCLLFIHRDEESARGTEIDRFPDTESCDQELLAQVDGWRADGLQEVGSATVYADRVPVIDDMWVKDTMRRAGERIADGRPDGGLRWM